MSRSNITDFIENTLPVPISQNPSWVAFSNLIIDTVKEELKANQQNVYKCDICGAIKFIQDDLCNGCGNRSCTEYGQLIQQTQQTQQTEWVVIMKVAVLDEPQEFVIKSKCNTDEATELVNKLNNNCVKNSLVSFIMRMA